MESSNSCMRNDGELFLHVDEMRYVVEHWRMDYNHYRPHSSQAYVTLWPRLWSYVVRSVISGHVRRSRISVGNRPSQFGNHGISGKHIMLKALDS